MVKLILNIISRFYNERIESICVRILYFFNSIDTNSVIIGAVSGFIVLPKEANFAVMLIVFLFAIATAKLADYYPFLMIFAIPVMVILGWALPLPLLISIRLILVNVFLFFSIQFLFMGIPDSIVARDIRVAFIKMYNSLFTVAPTAVSFSISVFFSFYLSFGLAVAAFSFTQGDFVLEGLAGTILLTGALITRWILPKNHFSKFHKPDTPAIPIFNKLVILNIDGVRKDIFDSLDLPTRDRLAREGTSHPIGLETVYRALTNPAFASILTGTVPKIHGVRNNNLNQSIKTEGLPDIVQTIAYGSMHIKHFCKKEWETRIVSLPRHSIYHCDDIMMEWLKEDMLQRTQVRLFVADFSEADFLAHAYGSTSRQYKEALARIDKRIGDFIDWLESTGLIDGTVVVVCSDHGIAGIDHSYLLAKSEKYVPFFLYGEGIKKGYQIQRPGKIMDICCTAAYLLGVRYPKDCRGQVFSEALERSDYDAEEEMLVARFNRLKYDAEAKDYSLRHAEIYEGDVDWWDDCIAKFAGHQKDLRVLDIGCGDGFIAQRFIKQKINFQEFVCMDISEDILAAARNALEVNRNFSFVNSLDKTKGPFGIITVGSLFHHIVQPQALARKIDSLLATGGLVIGSHEPNRAAFKNKVFFAAANLYKKMGGGISINDRTVERFNNLLISRYPHAPGVSREEIIQMVEYHSPIEQYDDDIDINRGFMPEEFCQNNFSGYEILSLQTYTTFFCRPWLSRHKLTQSLLRTGFNLFFKEGNLFRFVLRKR